MATQVVVTVPYEQGIEFTLDSASKRYQAVNGKVDEEGDRIMLTDNLVTLSGWSRDEMENVIAAAAALFAMRAGTIAQCLDTAMVWERG